MQKSWNRPANLPDSMDTGRKDPVCRDRKARFAKISELFEEAGFEVSQECFGSEDGEVIFIRSKRSEEHQRGSIGCLLLLPLSNFIQLCYFDKPESYLS